MSFTPRGLIACSAGTLLLLIPTASAASAAGAGGVAADTGSVSSPTAGGAEYGSASLRPRLRVQSIRLLRDRVTTGTSPRLRLRVDRRGARTVRVTIRIRGKSVGRTLRARRVRTGRTVTLRLPRGLRPGAYRVQVLAEGARGDLPARSGTLRLVVRKKPKPRPKRKPAPAPVPVPQAPPGDAPAAPVPPSLGGPDPGTATIAGVFPLRGTYSFGGADARFGAGRTGHIHEGQDLTAASGTPVVAPLAGAVLFNDYQAHGAGRYVVLHADNGWDMFFAHCLAGSAVLKPGARVAAGDQLCGVGATGDASGPHLHFELWPDGWRQVKGTRPIDPLPQLRRWAAG